MKLLLIRHAPAADRANYAPKGIDDSLRPLTDSGREKMARAAAGLKRTVPTIDTVASSPLVRAFETAEIVASAYGDLPIEEVPSLSPDCRPDDVLTWLRRLPDDGIVAAVGHEPALGHLASFLLSGAASSFVGFKKGGACLLDVDHEPSAGGAVLEWALAPRHLRGLA